MHQAPLLIAQRNGQAVDLWLGGEGEALHRLKAEESADALQKIAHALVVEHIAEREHGHGVHDLAEGLDRSGTNADRRAVLADEMREARLDRCVALPQRIVFGVGNLRLILPVIERVVTGDLAG